MKGLYFRFDVASGAEQTAAKGARKAAVEMNQFAEAIGRRLRTRRRLLGLTQAAVGEACGLTFQQIHKLESGRMMISAGRLWKLSNALGVQVSYFFEGLPQALVDALPEETTELDPQAPARATK